jgi:hypothetical protein
LRESARGCAAPKRSSFSFPLGAVEPVDVRPIEDLFGLQTDLFEREPFALMDDVRRTEPSRI